MNRIKEKFVYIAKKSVYDTLRETTADDNRDFKVISDDSIVFVGDEGAIYTHGHKFGGSSQNNESQQNGGSQSSN